MVERLILHLDMDAFFASVEQRTNPRLRGKPVLVCGNRSSRTVVATASYEARAFGVKTGMSLQEALALCPVAVIVEGDPAKYADLFRQVVRMMERYSPVLEVFSIDEAFLDLTDTADRFGGPLTVAKALQRAVRTRLGLPCSIGLGPNTLIAKLASSMKKPNGITQIRAAEIAQVLAELPIEELCGIGHAFQEALNAQGITTCGQLAQVPLARLIAQFGLYAGTHLYRLARGINDTPVVTTDQTPLAKSMGHLHTLSHDTSDPAVLRAVLLELSEKVGRRLRAEGAAGRTVTVTLRTQDFTTCSRERTFERFFDDGYDIYDAGRRILEDLRKPQAVRMLGICVSGLSYGPRQAWWLPEVLRQRRLLSACDRINNRFGDATLRRGALLGEPEARRHYQLKRYSARTLIATREPANPLTRKPFL
jgi:DNA polymerase-4